MFEENRYDNHYNYLDDHLDKFWVRVFGKNLSDTWNGGIISAHGDKGYGYRAAWKNAGIPFNHGMMLYMLTYTKVMDEEKHKSKDWVIAQYPKYKDILLEVEQEVEAENKGRGNAPE